MSEPLTDERRAEIRDIAARYRHRAYIGLEAMARGIDQFDAEIERLRRVADGHATGLDVLNTENDQLLARCTKGEDSLRAIRGWTRSRLESLAKLSYPSISADAKKAILDELTSVLDHLASAASRT